MKNIYVFFILLIFGYEINSAYGQPGCPSINAGPDQTTTCSQPCTNLTASVLATGLTTTYSVSSIPYTPPYPYNTGTPILVNIDDRWSGVINLPFTFCFYGNNYTQIVAGSNGVISFNPGYANGYCEWSFSASCPSSALPLNSIFGPYHDIDPGVGGSMYYAILGSYPCRTFVVNWYNVPMFSCNYLIATHQIVLYESTNVIEVYMQNKPLCSSWNSGNAIVGVQNASGSTGLAAPGRNTSPTWTASNEAWRFTPNGPANYTISWWQGGVQIGTGASIQVCPANSTTYTAQVVYDACTGLQVIVSDQVTVNTNNTLSVSASPPSSSICPGQTVYISASSNNPSTTYAWSTGSTSQSIGVSPTVTTTYTVTGTDNNGCHNIATATVNVHPSPVISVTPSAPSICQGTTITLAASSSNPGTNFTWYPGGVGQQISVTPNTTTTYVVSGSDGNGCSGSTQMTVTVNPNPAVSISPVNPSICYGTNINLTASSTIGGTTYQWNPGGSSANPFNVSPTTQTTYTVTGTAASGCTGTAVTTVSISPGLNITVSPPVATICQGSYIILTASGGINYNWSPATGLSGTNTAVVQASPSLTTTYTVAGSDNSGCTGTATVTVNVNPMPTSAFTVTSPVCSLNPSTFAYTGNATSAATYVWDFAGGVAVPGTGQGPHQVTWSAPGIYNVSLTVTELNCTSTTTVHAVSVSNISATASPVNVSCNGFNNGTATANPASGLTPYTYIWSTTPAQSTQTATGLGPGSYSVTVTDNAGCTASASVSITEPTALVATLVSTGNVSCNGGNNGTATVSTSGGTPPYGYTWSYGSGTGPSASGFPAGNYTVTVSDDHNCTEAVPFTITQPAALSLSISVLDETCKDYCDGTLQASVSGGTPPYLYFWSTSSTANQISSLCTGNYSLTVTDSHNCQKSASAIVATNTLIEASGYAYPVVGLLPLTVNFYFDGSGAMTYNWDFGDGDSSILQNPVHIYNDDDIFTVTLTANSGPPDFCTDVYTFTITVIRPSKIFIPNIVTPNGDAYNDVFRVKSEALATEQMLIYNRWGRKVFEWNEVGGEWDCLKENGGEYAHGTYYYVFYALGNDQVEYNQTGTFQVIK